MEWVSELLGRLHPLVIHLPIGFLVLGGLLWLKNRQSSEYPALLPTLFLWTGLAGALACLSGYLLYRSGGYAYESVETHLWFGLVTTLFCLLLYAKDKAFFLAPLKKLPLSALLGIGLVLIAITGHKGGTLTHGEGYLSEPLPRAVKKALGLPVFEELPIALTADNWKDTDLYDGVVHPILNNKCVGCHGPTQAKGGLRLHRQEDILSGGKNGPVIGAKTPDRSELLVRIGLPGENEDHMPPLEKEPLLREEIALLKAWVAAGHPFEGSIGEHGLEMALLEPFFPKNAADYYPDATLAPVPADSLKTARDNSLHVEPLSRDLPWLRVSALNKPDFSLADTLLMEPFVSLVVTLDLSNTRINDSLYHYLKRLPNLTVLNLAHTTVTERGIEQLASLGNLKNLNLNHTEITPALLAKLEAFPALEKVYVFGTLLPEDGPKSLKDGTVTIEYGGYVLPGIASDSISY